MAKLVSVFISAGHRRLIVAAIWAAAFAFVLGLIGIVAARQVGIVMRAEIGSALERFERLDENVRNTFAMLHKDVTAEPCSPAFGSQLRKVAFLPDGLSEFIYAPDGVVRCSISAPRLAAPVALGAPDITADGVAIWLDRDLGFLRLDGLHGTIALSEPFAVVVPKQQIVTPFHPWVELETGLAAPDNSWWHRSGTPGINEHHENRLASGSAWSPLHAGAFVLRQCGGSGLQCVAARARLADILAAEWKRFLVALVGAALVAAWVAAQGSRLIRAYWSLEARFRRHLDAGSIVLAYQPIIHLESGRVSGCEVLARWRDVDDTILFPDAFIGIVERYDLTRRFTSLVAQRAFEELSSLPDQVRLRVNFNIFPRDLDGDTLREIFSIFDQARERFEITLEIVESGAIQADSAQREIEELRRAGIDIYIDDFGAGYSNMANLATLSVDGVKLDRAFALAPDGSLTAQMLVHAVEMIRATGRAMVIEGVETAERLAQLRRWATPLDHAQGYFISRPLAIDRFAAFLADHEPQPASIEATAIAGPGASRIVA
ncbi:EAL domain-containing protein [Mesorhizobium sp. L-8-3]|uniref:EAL domain-containing protein n=1 Tax=Mesorhizobium sp. L-8-3 TaxID=2744522 RepID=UPI00192896FF|nr:cyclic diguanylate phosphodiesterase [Mesorhizobium sp. L-8-3]BCH24796.1 cyclic diguanylate phosphodiesterase [Mesorhizobium sp. L-8-3]